MGVDHMDRLHPVTRAAHIGMGAAVGLPQRLLYERPRFALYIKTNPFEATLAACQLVDREPRCRDTWRGTRGCANSAPRSCSPGTRVAKDLSFREYVTHLTLTYQIFCFKIILFSYSTSHPSFVGAVHHSVPLRVVVRDHVWRGRHGHFDVVVCEWIN